MSARVVKFLFDCLGYNWFKGYRGVSVGMVGNGKGGGAVGNQSAFRTDLKGKGTRNHAKRRGRSGRDSECAGLKYFFSGEESSKTLSKSQKMCQLVSVILCHVSSRFRNWFKAGCLTNMI